MQCQATFTTLGPLASSLAENFPATTREQIWSSLRIWMDGRVMDFAKPGRGFPLFWRFSICRRVCACGIRLWMSVATTKVGLRGTRLPLSLRKDNDWSLSGPVLRVGVSAWTLTLGMDPGPFCNEDGFTVPLLVANPEDWVSGLMEVSLCGCQREMLCSKCEGGR